MDIFKFANEYGTDYMAPNGYIYHCQEYVDAKKRGENTFGIRVSCDGETIGYCHEEEK